MTDPTEAQSGSELNKKPLPLLFSQLGDWLQLLRSQWSSQLTLLSLETQLAAQSLVMIWLFTLMASLAVIGCWVLLQLLLWQLMVRFGWQDWQALLLLCLLQLVLLYCCLRAIRQQSQHLCFPATVASLKAITTTKPIQESV